MPRSAFSLWCRGGWDWSLSPPDLLCASESAVVAPGAAGRFLVRQVRQAGAARRLLGTILESRRTFRPSRAPSDTERPKQCPETSEPPRRATRQPDQIGDPPIDGVATVDEDRSATNAVRPASGAARGRRARPVKAAGAATAPSAQQRAGATKRLDGPETSAPSPQWIRPAARRGMVALGAPQHGRPRPPTLPSRDTRRFLGAILESRRTIVTSRAPSDTEKPKQCPETPRARRLRPAGVPPAGGRGTFGPSGAPSCTEKAKYRPETPRARRRPGHQPGPPQLRSERSRYRSIAALAQEVLGFRSDATISWFSRTAGSSRICNDRPRWASARRRSPRS